MYIYTAINRYSRLLQVALIILTGIFFILPVCAAYAATDFAEKNKIAIERSKVANQSAWIESTQKNMAAIEKKMDAQKKVSQDIADKIKATEAMIERKKKVLSYLKNDKYSDVKTSIKDKIGKLERHKKDMQDKKSISDFELNQSIRELKQDQADLADTQQDLKKSRQHLADMLEQNPDIAKACKGCDEVKQQMDAIGSREDLDKALKDAESAIRKAKKKTKKAASKLADAQQQSSSSSSSGAGGSGGGIFGAMGKVIHEIEKANTGGSDSESLANEDKQAKEKELADKIKQLKAQQQKYDELQARQKDCKKSACYPKENPLKGRQLGETDPADAVADAAGDGTPGDDSSLEDEATSGDIDLEPAEEKDKRKTASDHPKSNTQPDKGKKKKSPQINLPLGESDAGYRDVPVSNASNSGDEAKPESAEERGKKNKPASKPESTEPTEKKGEMATTTGDKPPKGKGTTPGKKDEGVTQTNKSPPPDSPASDQAKADKLNGKEKPGKKEAVDVGKKSPGKDKDQAAKKAKAEAARQKHDRDCANMAKWKSTLEKINFQIAKAESDYKNNKAVNEYRVLSGERKKINSRLKVYARALKGGLKLSASEKSDQQLLLAREKFIHARLNKTAPDVMEAYHLRENKISGNEILDDGLNGEKNKAKKEVINYSELCAPEGFDFTPDDLYDGDSIL